jgi:hypothetical protein
MNLLKQAIFVLLLFSFNSNAEQKITKGNWDIHYIAFPSSFIEPEVAKQYQLQRSKYLSIINISVLDNKNNNKAQNAYVSGVAKNLLGQRFKLDFVKVTEGEATYYLAQVKYDNEEIYNFEVDVQQGDRTETIKFTQKFYVD